MLDRLIRPLAGVAALSWAGFAFSQGCLVAPPITVGDTPFDTAGATEILDLTGICDPGPFGDDSIYHTIWFSWVATSTESYQISTCNQANFDTRLAVLENGCDPSNTIACLDDTAGCTGFTTTLAFAAVEGNTYYFAVGGYAAVTPSGSGTLTLSLAGGGGGGNICGGKNPQSCCTAGTAPGCSDADCCNAICANDDFCCSTQWDGLCASAAAAQCSACIVPCDAPAPTTFEVEPCGSDTNGGCNARFAMYSPIAVGDIVEGNFWAGGGTRDTDWYLLNLEVATELTATLYASVPARTFLLTGSCPASLLAANPAEGGCPSSWTKCVPPGQYVVFVATAGFDGPACDSGIANTYTLALTGVPCDASAPRNDECSGAESVESGDTFFDSSFATTSADPLDPSCDEGFGLDFVQDLWFVWEARCDGVATVSTCSQASFDTRLAAYIDCNGTQIACNDDSTGCTGFTSKMTFPCTQGQSYYLRVGGFATGGTGTLTISCALPLENDECEGASPIADGGTPFSTIGATTSPLPLDAACDEGLGTAIVDDIWFRYVASCTGDVTVSTCGAANFDTRLAAYSDCIGTLIACNDDDASCGLQSQMIFAATSGQVIYIRVGGFSGSGSGTLSISCGGGGGGCTSNDTCACATAIALGDTAFTTVGTNSDAPTASPAFCGTFGTGFFHDIWYVFEPTTDGQLTVSTCSQASYDTRLELWNGCPADGGVVVACNDDGEGCTGFTSLMEGSVQCGVTYYIRVGSYSATVTGTGTLSVSQATGNSCEKGCVPGPDRNGDGCVDGFDLGLVLGNWDPAGSLGNGLGQGDVNCDGLVDGFDLGEVLGSWLVGCP